MFLPTQALPLFAWQPVHVVLYNFLRYIFSVPQRPLSHHQLVRGFPLSLLLFISPSPAGCVFLTFKLIRHFLAFPATAYSYLCFI